MKTNNIESRISFIIISLGIFLLNIKSFSFLGIICGSLLSLLVILLLDKLKLDKYKFFNIFLIIFSFLFLILYLNKITYFIGDNILREYSLVSISLTLLIAIYLLLRKNYHSIIKVILLAAYFIFIFFLIGFLLTIPYMKLSNVNIHLFSTNTLLNESLYYTLLITYTYLLTYRVSNTKFKVKDLIISFGFNIITYLSIISILGQVLMYIFKYPYISIFKKVSLIGFIERIEIIFSLNYLFTFFFLFLLAFYNIKYNLSFLIKKTKINNLVLIILTILIFLINIMLM